MIPYEGLFPLAGFAVDTFSSLYGRLTLVFAERELID